MDFEINPKFYKKWKYGFIEGLIIGIIILVVGALAINPFLFVEHNFMMFWTFIMVIPIFAFSTLTLSAVLQLSKIPKQLNHNPSLNKIPKKPTPCPECGSTRRHFKTCSHFKKKEEKE